MNQPIMNKMLLRKNKEIKKAWKSAKKHYVRRDRGGLKLKGVLLKVVQTFPGQEEPVNMVSDSNQAAGIASVTKENLIEAVKAVQLNGMSGNGFPVAQKLEAFANAGSKHKILLINAVECDPGLLHDEWLVHSHLEEINQGILAIREAFGIERSILALKAVRNVSEESNGITLTAEVEICPVAARYPAGEEHFLIHSALGIELSESELPTNQGILVMNVQTVWQIGRIVKGTFDGGVVTYQLQMYKTELRSRFMWATILRLQRSFKKPLVLNLHRSTNAMPVVESWLHMRRISRKPARIKSALLHISR